jgi:MFS family permease
VTRSARDPRLVAGMCVGETLGMLGAFTFPALQAEFAKAWGLSNTECGWISGVYFAAYAAAVLVLASLTDRVDARSVHLLGVAVTAAAAAGFALFAHGFATALLFRALAGVGLAGAFIPGLKALVDRISEGGRARGMALYTATFSLGTTASFFAAGEMERRMGWRSAFWLAAGAAAAAFLVAAVLLEPKAPREAARESGTLRDLGAVLKNRGSMAYVTAYAGHMWELFAFRNWMVAFLAFSRGLHPGPLAGWSPTAVASLTGLVAMWANVAGAELANRHGRRRVVSIIMGISALVACATGFAARLPYIAVAALCVFYSLFVQGDSAALYAGVLEGAAPERRGTTLAVQSLTGFLAAALGSLAVGCVLDLTGGGTSVASWGIAFAAMGLGSAVGPFVLRAATRPESPARR